MFSERITEATHRSPDIVFDGVLRAIIDPDIQKCRSAREEAWRLAPPQLVKQLKEETPQALMNEYDLRFDTSQYALRETFADMLDVDPLQLDRLHERFIGDAGRKGNRQEKLQMLSGLVDAERRRRFVDTYLRFLAEVIVPCVATDACCDTVACQSFPCVRVNRPGEFSIGPHCDLQYGHGIGNINLYLPLSDIWGTNSLWLESSPGAEDWHAIRATYGTVKRFWGGSCTHFTVPNETASTRVSLDMRCVPGPVFELQRGLDQYMLDGEYYFLMGRDEGTGKFVPKTPVGEPSKLMGFPFTEPSKRRNAIT